jgi:hypothetical protein
LASTMRLRVSNRSKVLRVRRSMRVTVTTSPARQPVELPQKLPPVGPRARHLPR